MDDDPIAAFPVDDVRRVAVMQWAARLPGAAARSVHIQVGTVAGGGWYVRHRGFGLREYADRHAAWRAVRGLMTYHDGRWEQVDVDAAPFATVCGPDGSRVLYDTHDDECLHSYWGRRQEQIWASYLDAINGGAVLRCTETHAFLDGQIELVRYEDPYDGTERYAVSTARETGVDWRVVDHAGLAAADDEYEESVRSNADDELPYRSSDVPDASVRRRSSSPAGLRILDSGVIVAEDDLDTYNDMYHLPYRNRWPLNADESPVPPGAVGPMSAEPRDWGPSATDVRDVTPASMRDEGAMPRVNALALAVLPDGRQLLATGHDDIATVWNVRTGARVRDVSGHTEWILSVRVAVLSDGAPVLATGGKDGQARAWSVRDGDPLVEIPAHEWPVNALSWALLPGRVPMLVTGSDDATVVVWDAENRAIIRKLTMGTPGLQLVWSTASAVLADGRLCVVAGVVPEGVAPVQVWDATNGCRLHELTMGPGDWRWERPAVAVATLADRSYRVAATAGDEVRVWDGHTGRVIRTLAMPQPGAGDVALAALPDLRTVVAATIGRHTRVWEVESGVLLAELDHADTSPTPVVDLAVLPDDGLLLAAGGASVPPRLVQLDVRW
ncbi:WD40 repeat domain-containing protein [Micromonospora okii]|uniref:WD40 repeat domain-containing protein n=1 Tax=Micromonospora okii TaxID=1182970 RepID=UPI001E5FE4A0|nr:WD40 repeat domain-containing protein [Micromonospora okii]